MQAPGLPRVLPSLPQTPLASSGVHFHLLPLRSKSFRGLTILKKSGTIRRYHDTTLRYCRSSLTVEGCSSSAMATTFSGSVPIPSLGTRCPMSAVSQHFSGLRLRFASFRSRNTSLRFCFCSSSVRPITIMSGKRMSEVTFRGQLLCPKPAEMLPTQSGAQTAFPFTGINLCLCTAYCFLPDVPDVPRLP